MGGAIGAVKEYDYIIVGAGSAGCVLANRLSKAGHTVLLLEAGGWDRDPLIHIPLGWGIIFKNRRHDWGYFCEPEDAVAGRPVECARGKVVGGSSSTNAMAYVRGDWGTYRRWASHTGSDEFGPDGVLPFFKRQERWGGPADEWRGDQGPVATQFCRYEDGLVDAFAEAGRAAFGWTDDYNGRGQEGFARLQMSIDNGRRASSASAYLRPALMEPNLEVITGAVVGRIEMDGTRATGVFYRTEGEGIDYARANGDVILAGGVVNSPQLLMLSGIGPAETLDTHEIDVAAALPGVGQNLADHPSVIAMYHRAEPGPFHKMMRYDRIVPDLAKTYFQGNGFSSDVPGGVTAFLRSTQARDVPDLQVLFTAAPLASWPYLAPLRKPFADGFATRIVLTQPDSRGSITLKSDNPFDAPAIRQNFLSAERDLTVLREGLAIARDLAASGPMAPFVKAEIAPGPAAKTDADLDTHIRQTMITVHHPAGTCRMGPSPDGGDVVDTDFRVHGTTNLRVVDASVMPDLPNGNINAAVLMLAEMAASKIIAETSAAPAMAA